jgi:hypothetical protein
MIVRIINAIGVTEEGVEQGTLLNQIMHVERGPPGAIAPVPQVSAEFRQFSTAKWLELAVPVP